MMSHDRLHNKSTEENECMQDSQIIIFHHYSAVYQTRTKGFPHILISRKIDTPASRSLPCFERSWASWMAAIGECLPAKGRGTLWDSALKSPGFKLKIWWSQVRNGVCKNESTCKWLHPEDDALKKIQESLRLVGNRVDKSPAFLGLPTALNSVYVMMLPALQ